MKISYSKVFKDIDVVLEELFDKLCETIELTVEDKIKFKKYLEQRLENNVSIIRRQSKTEKLHKIVELRIEKSKTEKLHKIVELRIEKSKTEKLHKIVELIEQLKREMFESLKLSRNSNDILPKKDYDLSNLIINIKEIEKLLYIEKLRVLEIAIEKRPRIIEPSKTEKYEENMKKIKKLRKYDRMEKLTWQSGIIQFGFSLGLLITALVGMYFQNNILNFTLLSYLQYVYVYGGLAGLVWFIILFLFLKRISCLEITKMKKHKKLRDFIGIRELLQNENNSNNSIQFLVNYDRFDVFVLFYNYSCIKNVTQKQHIKLGLSQGYIGNINFLVYNL